MIHAQLRLLSLVILLVSGMSQAAPPEEVIQQSFYPYENWTPSYPGYESGVVINQDNVDQFREIMDAALYRFIKDGWVEITTAPTTDFALSEDYVNATRNHSAGVKLLDNGTLENVVAGRPFPEEPDINDPDAGQKLIWNYQYGFNAGDAERIYPFWWTFRDMRTDKVERIIKFDAKFMKWQQRVTFDPKPALEKNPSTIYRSLYMYAEEPFDIKNTQLLIHRYRDDLRRDDAWLYLGFQRRVRRLAAGQITDSFLGTDIMIEDFEGYNSRVTDYNWEYGGTRNLLVPFYHHNEMDLADEPVNDPDGYRFIEAHGKGNCFPKVTYQLRKIYLLNGYPKDSEHPLSKREINMDAQTSTMATLLIYDRKGDLWKWFPIGKAHSDYHLPGNRDKGVTLDDFASFIDVQALHCTTLQFKSLITNDGIDPKIFSVQNLRKSGR